MVSLETLQFSPDNSSPRISFSSDFLDEADFISISPNGDREDAEILQVKEITIKTKPERPKNPDFEFLSSNASSHKMLTADELFFEGKLLPFWQIHQAERLNRISLKSKEEEGEEKGQSEQSMHKQSVSEQSRVSWFLDDDPSPRPPKCTVLWKELLRLKKQRANSSLSTSSSSSSTSSSSSSMADAAAMGEKKESNIKSQLKRIQRGLERTRSASIRIRPMVNVPICTQVKGGALPPLFPIKKGRVSL